LSGAASLGVCEKGGKGWVKRKEYKRLFEREGGRIRRNPRIWCITEGEASGRFLGGKEKKRGKLLGDPG